ncbi:DUF6951 family protein [Acetobacterium bakii]|uniref:Uncharacterized protein n=1 Tax=Acetobacterium bakii TaxID=52689 RepID=A0A0L6U242_9FIRM|nr:hypothetical protein [Acetobacterium bakii]KNZ41840.1 hypothetical protein AKG39_09455 [Acetobacterium bakii]
MAKAEIFGGVCGFTTVVTAEKSGRGNILLDIASGCPAFKDLGDDLKEVDGMVCAFSKVGEGPIYDACRIHCKHGACPVPMGIVKAVEVAAGLALPRDATVILSK